MGYHIGKSAPSLLRMNYERYLYPYDIFQAGAFTGDPHSQVWLLFCNESYVLRISTAIKPGLHCEHRHTHKHKHDEVYTCCISVREVT